MEQIEEKTQDSEKVTPQSRRSALSQVVNFFTLIVFPLVLLSVLVITSIHSVEEGRQLKTYLQKGPEFPVQKLDDEAVPSPEDSTSQLPTESKSIPSIHEPSSESEEEPIILVNVPVESQETIVPLIPILQDDGDDIGQEDSKAFDSSEGRLFVEVLEPIELPLSESEENNKETFPFPETPISKATDEGSDEEFIQTWLNKHSQAEDGETLIQLPEVSEDEILKEENPDEDEEEEVIVDSDAAPFWDPQS